MASITCGHCGESHHAVTTVRDCHAGITFPCSTHVVRYTEDGPESAECGAASWADRRGHSCEAGHSHVYAQVRIMEEGWDYASDAQEANVLRAYGLGAVSMIGASI
jgi:hypothetical protein